MAVTSELLKRILFFLIGLILIALGISVTIIADFGCGGWDATNIALVRHFGLSVGTWLNIWAFVYLLIACMIERKRYRIECMATSLIIGAGVDLFNYLLRFAAFEEAWLKPLVFILGTIIISLGAGFYLVSKLPPNPTDYMMMCIKEHFHLSITFAKTLVEAIGIVLALLLGGPVGIGTFLMIVIFGPCIDFFYQIAEHFYQRISRA